MASKEDWCITYRDYEPQELEDEIRSLKEQKTLWNQQQSGGQSGTINLDELRSQLAAATMVKNERSSNGHGNAQHGVMDFSHIQL